MTVSLTPSGLRGRSRGSRATRGSAWSSVKSDLLLGGVRLERIRAYECEVFVENVSCDAIHDASPTKRWLLNNVIANPHPHISSAQIDGIGQSVKSSRTAPTRGSRVGSGPGGEELERPG